MMSSNLAVPLLVPDFPSPQELMPYLQRMHEVKQYSNFGPLVRELEEKIAVLFGTSDGHCVVSAVTASSATLGLELALMALKLPPQSKVLIPALTFVATATAVVRAGHIPVMGDVDLDSWLLTPEIALRTRQTLPYDAVIPVATFGAPQDMRAWHQFELATGCPVIVDAAGAFGSQWLSGAEGTIVFSLHATKSLPAGEGGLVVSSNADLLARIRQLSNFGLNLSQGTSVPPGHLASVGTNAKMSEFHAAVALASLARWEAGAAKRRMLFKSFYEAFEAVAGGSLRWQATPAPGIAAPVLFCVRMQSAEQRSQLEQFCSARNIATRRWYQPILNAMEGVELAWQSGHTPNAQAIAGDLIGLPFFPSMSIEQQQAIVNVMSQVMATQRVTA